ELTRLRREDRFSWRSETVDKQSGMDCQKGDQAEMLFCNLCFLARLSASAPAKRMGAPMMSPRNAAIQLVRANSFHPVELDWPRNGLASSTRLSSEILTPAFSK